MATVDQLVDVALRHAQAEADGDLDATMATLEDDCVYELQPMGLRLVGRDNARAYYDWFFPNFMPRVANYEMRAEWINDQGVAQEYRIWVRGDDGQVEEHDLIGILCFGNELLSGERLYADERILRMMFGPLYDDAEAVPVA
jgi:SnoaL-like domain